MIRVQGAAAAARRLEDIAEAISGGVAAAIFTESIALEAEAKRRCPVKTGALRDSIAAAAQARNAGAEAAVGSNLAYAPAVELGMPGSPPRPFLEPALRARRGALEDRVQQAMRRAMEGDRE